MIIVMKSHASESDIAHVVERVKALGLNPHPVYGVERTIIGVIGDERLIQKEQLSLLPHVEDVIPILKPYKLASREFRQENTIVHVAGVPVGGKGVIVIAGPCSVETEEQVLGTAEAVKAAGASLLRGGAYKPRTSPYAFQGLGEDGLKLLAKAREKTGLGIVTEVMEAAEVDLVADHADLLQVGARNMQNTKLLRALSKIKKPILLKRNFSATLNEFLMSAEYILSGGNDQVILCERGIRTFVEYTRNTLDLNIVPAVKQLSHLPIIVDPSHGTGRHDLIVPMSRAAIAAGADGLIVEVHPNPSEAYSDGEQSLTFSAFRELMSEVKCIATAMGRNIS
ncbi:MAG: 3-deoxy-7-phosphoheptulonate synthase [Ignavibacteriae bacterium]|nr:3-deoxy-7-phosphoheptulonate synthase [Ignavibacteria bacterium]MBI3364801.1 3-deoxy-7-phosphoheptulonate synthase [Ignavibacteriota bacterium]